VSVTTSPRSRVVTWVLPGVVALVILAVAWPTALRELGVAPPVGFVLGLAAAVPMVVIVARPVVAWGLSALGAAVVAMTIGASPGRPSPFGVVHEIVLLVLLTAVVLTAPRRTAVGASVGTAVVFVLGVDSPGVLLSALLVVSFAIVFAWLVRALVVSRRRLAVSEEVSERERARRAVLEERARIARDLHDVVAHAMSMIVVRTETAPYRLSELTPDVREELAEIGSAARSSLAEVRGLLGVLREPAEADAAPGPRPPQPGIEDLEDLLTTSRRAGMTIEVECGDGTGRVGDVGAATGLSLYRILAEALANAARHAAGAPVTVALGTTDTTVSLEVAHGPGEDSGPGSGLGLPGMRERVAVVGGELEAGPTNDLGWRVRAVLPREVGNVAPVTEGIDEHTGR
jgi:signal transduction histidine kinase